MTITPNELDNLLNARKEAEEKLKAAETQQVHASGVINAARAGLDEARTPNVQQSAQSQLKTAEQRLQAAVVEVTLARKELKEINKWIGTVQAPNAPQPPAPPIPLQVKSPEPVITPAAGKTSGPAQPDALAVQTVYQPSFTQPPKGTEARDMANLVSAVAPPPNFQKMAQETAAAPLQLRFYNAQEELLWTREEQKRAVAEKIVETVAPQSARTVHAGKILPGEKLYAFQTAVEGKYAGWKSADSPYYATGDQVRSMRDAGLIDFDKKTFNAEGIRDFLGLPPNNKVNCLVEVEAKTRAAYVETQIGEVAWKRDNEAVHQQGGGYQVHPDLQVLNQSRADTRQLPIATLDGQLCDFRGFKEVNQALTPEQHTAIREDYEARRAAAPERARDEHLMRIANLEQRQDELKDEIQNKVLETKDYAHSKVQDLRREAGRVAADLQSERFQWVECCVIQPDLYQSLDQGIPNDLANNQQVGMSR